MPSNNFCFPQVTDARDGQSRTIRQFQFTGNIASIWLTWMILASDWPMMDKLENADL